MKNKLFYTMDLHEIAVMYIVDSVKINVYKK